MLLLYQILFRYILKSNSENIIYICLKIFKKMDKEYIENKLNKLLRLNSFTSFMLFISITVLLIWTFILLIYVSFNLKTDIEDFCREYYHIHASKIPNWP